MMKFKASDNVPFNYQAVRVLVATVLVLLVPLIAMQFTDQVDWGVLDFATAGILLFGTGLVYELGVRKVRAGRSRIVAGTIVLAVFLLIWAELAVGIFD